MCPFILESRRTWMCKWKPSLRDRSRVVPRSDSACVSTERFLRSGNAGFTKSRRVIGEHVSHPLVGWRTSDQDGWGLRSNLICRGIFEDFHAGSKGNLYSKIATPRYHWRYCVLYHSPIGEYGSFLRVTWFYSLATALDALNRLLTSISLQ